MPAWNWSSTHGTFASSLAAADPLLTRARHRQPLESRRSRPWPGGLPDSGTERSWVRIPLVLVGFVTGDCGHGARPVPERLPVIDTRHSVTSPNHTGTRSREDGSGRRAPTPPQVPRRPSVRRFEALGVQISRASGEGTRTTKVTGDVVRGRRSWSGGTGGWGGADHGGRSGGVGDRCRPGADERRCGAGPRAGPRWRGAGGRRGRAPPGRGAAAAPAPGDPGVGSTPVLGARRRLRRRSARHHRRRGPGRARPGARCRRRDRHDATTPRPPVVARRGRDR